MNPKLNESGQEVQYPERPGEADCTYYMRTGICGFGSKCKYNHPTRNVVSASQAASRYLQRYGKPECQNEKECSYYVQTGYCKFGKNCKFHHPQPSGIPMPMTTSTFFPTQQQHMVGLPMPTPSFLPAVPPQGLVLAPGWTPYPVEVGATRSPDHLHQWAGTSFMYVPWYQMDPFIPSVHSAVSSYFSPSAPSGPLPISAQAEHVFPERPGQPECRFYKRTGNCRFGIACKYHHPRNRYVLSTSCALSPVGLPSRPGAPRCSFYAHHGICKFGPTCKFDHPMGTISYSPSASSLIDMPVAPYPVTSSSATVVPSNSSESQTEAVVMSKDANSMLEAPLLSSTSELELGEQKSLASSVGSTSEIGHG